MLSYNSHILQRIRYTVPHVNAKRKIENNLQDAIIHGSLNEVKEIVAAGMIVIVLNI